MYTSTEKTDSHITKKQITVKNRFLHKKKTNLRLLDTRNELITLLHRTSSHTTISLTPVKIYPSSVNEMHLNFSFFNDISIVSSSFRAGVLAFHGTWYYIFSIRWIDGDNDGMCLLDIIYNIMTIAKCYVPCRYTMLC